MKNNSWIEVKPNRYKYVKTIRICWIISFILLLSMYVIKKNNFKFMLLDLLIGCIPLMLSYITKENKSLIQKLDGFIKTNNLLKQHIHEGVIVYDYYPIMFVKHGNNNIQLKIRLDGSLLAEKFKSNDIEKALEGLLKAVCIEKYEDIGYLYLTFDFLSQEQLHIKLEDIKLDDDSNAIEFAPGISVDILKQPHFLLTGISGSGKSYYALYLIAKLATNGVKVYYLDPKNDLNMKAYIDKIAGCTYISNIDEIHNVIVSSEREMRKRQSDMDKLPGVTITFNPIYLVFDEILAFNKIAEKNILKETMDSLASIIVMGRSKQVFVGVIAQRIDTKFLDGALRENLSIRIALGNQTSVSYAMTFGEEFSDVCNRSKVLGSGLIIRQGIDSRPRPFIAPYLEE